MELKLKRVFFSETSTIGELYINDVFVCHILEDKDRNLTDTSLPSEKVHGRTAIPYGRYEIVLSYSARFKKILPLLVNVHLFLGIRIHPGNTSVDTEGCLLPGIWDGKTEMVKFSRITFNKLFATIKKE